MTTQALPHPEAIINQWTWKTPAMKRMTIAVCKLALARGHGVDFSALDLPAQGSEEHGGTGIAGTVFRQLADGGIIAPSGEFMGGQLFQRRVRNKGGNPIGVWRLANGSLARALLTAHDEPPPRPVQLEMFPRPSAIAQGL